MNLLKLSYKYMVAKPLNAFLSLLLVGLSIALISVAFHLEKAFSEKIQKNTSGIDMVIGAKGSPLQLILSSVLHVDAPTGNINYKRAAQATKNPHVEKAIPISYGDNYNGYRIVGSTQAFPEIYDAKIASGRSFEKSMEVVFGSEVAAKLGISTGDEIVSGHGLLEEAIEDHEDSRLKVVGIYAPTNTILDNLITTPLETVWEIHQHHEANLEDTEREVTALLVKFRNPIAMVQLPRQINANTKMQAALTNYELDRLFSFTGVGIKVITMIAYAILLFSVFSIFINLYRLVRDRRYELALMRTYGASNWQLAFVVFLEGFILLVIGYVLGLCLSRLGLYIFSNYLENEFKYTITQLSFIIEEAYVFLIILLLLISATVLATIPVFRLDVSAILSEE
ncbi:ABC transporter permease [Sungkyunkwania multivorans]|uniref:ABC transporter permease n=1 Tax=Sungkyunkwania multivorans TaxID=1173618 RepID=A0ABW3CYV1_9FLAO